MSARSIGFRVLDESTFNGSDRRGLCLWWDLWSLTQMHEGRSASRRARAVKSNMPMTWRVQPVQQVSQLHSSSIGAPRVFIQHKSTYWILKLPFSILLTRWNFDRVVLFQRWRASHCLLIQLRLVHIHIGIHTVLIRSCIVSLCIVGCIDIVASGQPGWKAVRRVVEEHELWRHYRKS